MVSIEESVYSGGQVPCRTFQLVVQVEPAASRPEGEAGAGVEPAAPPPQGSTPLGDVPPGKVRQVVRWGLKREKLLLLT